MKEHEIETHVKTVCKKLETDGIIVNEDGNEVKIPCDAVLIAAGSIPNTTIVDMVDKCDIPYEVIGDNSKVGQVLAAIWEGNRIGRTI